MWGAGPRAGWKAASQASASSVLVAGRIEAGELAPPVRTYVDSHTARAASDNFLGLLNIIGIEILQSPYDAITKETAAVAVAKN